MADQRPRDPELTPASTPASTDASTDTPIDSGFEASADSMIQGYVDFETLGAANADHSAEGVLGVLIDTERALRSARTQILEEMRNERRAVEIFRIVSGTLPVAMRAAAPSLIEITDTLVAALDGDMQDDAADAATATRTGSSIGHSIGPSIGPRALAVLQSWLSIADTTRVVAIAGFEISLQLGRAPNGKPIAA